MDSKHMLAAIVVIWVTATLIAIYAPEMRTSGDTFPIASWAAIVAAAAATFFLVYWRRPD